MKIMTVLLLLVLTMLIGFMPLLYIVSDDFCRQAFPEFPNMALFLFIAAFAIYALILLSDWYDLEDKMAGSNKEGGNVKEERKYGKIKKRFEKLQILQL